jgi:hypothetical protein
MALIEADQGCIGTSAGSLRPPRDGRAARSVAQVSGGTFSATKKSRRPSGDHAKRSIWTEFEPSSGSEANPPERCTTARSSLPSGLTNSTSPS